MFLVFLLKNNITNVSCKCIITSVPNLVSCAAVQITAMQQIILIIGL